MIRAADLTAEMAVLPRLHPHEVAAGDVPRGSLRAVPDMTIRDVLDSVIRTAHERDDDVVCRYHLACWFDALKTLVEVFGPAAESDPVPDLLKFLGHYHWMRCQRSMRYKLPGAASLRCFPGLQPRKGKESFTHSQKVSRKQD
jgi:hypothetical protein